MTGTARFPFALAGLLASLTVGGCGGDDGPMTPMNIPDAPIPQMTAQVDHIVALEGQSQFVTSLTPANGSPLTNARLVVDERAAAMEIVEQRCNNRRCVAHLRILDSEPNRGTPIPAPFDANNGYLSIVADEGEWRGLISVRPLDDVSHLGMDTISIRGGMLASDVEMVESATFNAAVVNEPIRWVLTSGGEIHGTIDVSAVGTEARGGGGNGGAATLDGEGSAGGQSAPDAMTGAGGGAGRYAGEGGGEGGGGGGDAQGVASCPNDYTATVCGGSGGGGSSDAAGGGGAGTLLLVSLEPLDLSAARLRAVGGAAGGAGAGGGGGGNIVIAAPSWTAPAELDAAGGAGQAPGGAGGEGLLRVDVPGASVEGAVHAPLYDITSIPPITDNPMLTVTGVAEPDSRVSASIKDGARLANTTAGADGAFELTVALSPGTNRIVLTSSGAWGELSSWLGRSIDFVRVGPDAFPVAGVLDVAYLPASE